VLNLHFQYKKIFIMEKKKKKKKKKLRKFIEKFYSSAKYVFRDKTVTTFMKSIFKKKILMWSSSLAN